MKKTLKKIALIAVIAAAVMFAAVSNGKLGIREFVYTITLPLALVVSCKNESDTTINVPPVAVAGVDGGALEDGKYEFDFTLPDNRSITLKGSGTDTDGTIAANGYAWACTKSPDNSFAAFTSTEQNPTINNFPKLGDYEFSLKVKDNEDAESAASVVKVALYRTASANISIQPIIFTRSNELNFAPTYISDNTTDFPVADIGNYLTYTVTATGVKVGTSDVFTHTWNSANGFDGKVVYDSGDDYNTTWTTFTQAFYRNGTNLNKDRVLVVMALGGEFQYFDGDEIWAETSSIPSISGISLSRKVSEGNVQ